MKCYIKLFESFEEDWLYDLGMTGQEDFVLTRFKSKTGFDLGPLIDKGPYLHLYPVLAGKTPIPDELASYLKLAVLPQSGRFYLELNQPFQTDSITWKPGYGPGSPKVVRRKWVNLTEWDEHLLGPDSNIKQAMNDILIYIVTGNLMGIRSSIDPDDSTLPWDPTPYLDTNYS